MQFTYSDEVAGRPDFAAACRDESGKMVEAAGEWGEGVKGCWSLGRDLAGRDVLTLTLSDGEVEVAGDIWVWGLDSPYMRSAQRYLLWSKFMGAQDRRWLDSLAHAETAA